MKRIFIITCLIFLVQFSAKAQGNPDPIICWPPVATIELHSQAQVDSFPITFDPDIQNWCWDLEISGGDITNVDSLDLITRITGSLIIGVGENSTNPLSEVNALLTDLSGLSNVTILGGKLALYGNPILSDLTGIGQLNYDSIIDIAILDNPLLTACNIESVCGFLSINDSNISIENNAPGCNSIEEVEAACGITGINDLEQSFDIAFYPNPFNDKITIEISGNLKAEPVGYQLFNAIGKVLIQSAQIKNNREEIDTSGLPPGVYFIQLRSDSKSSSHQLVKL